MWGGSGAVAAAHGREVGGTLPGRRQLALCASRYAALTEAGIRPRSLTVCPFSRAQDRSSALLTFASGVRARRRRFVDRVRLARRCPFRREVLSAAGCAGASAVASPDPVVRVTLYIAPMTRMASSNGSLESMVILICGSSTLADRHGHGRPFVASLACEPTEVGHEALDRHNFDPRMDFLRVETSHGWICFPFRRPPESAGPSTEAVRCQRLWVRVEFPQAPNDVP